MKVLIPFLLLLSAAAPSLAAETDLEKRVEALEFATYEQPFRLGGIFETRFDSSSYKPKAGKKVTVNISRLRFSLDLSAKPTDRLTFYGRYTVTKVMNDIQDNRTTSVRGESNLRKDRGYQSNEVMLERAFINYTMTHSLTLTVGRLPALDGPPNHLLDNVPRQGSYPKLLYATAVDGYALTYTRQTSSTDSLSARFIYEPFHSFNDNGFFTNQRYSAATRNNGPMDKVSDVTNGMLDYASTNCLLGGGCLAVFQVINLSRNSLADPLPIGTDISVTQGLPAGTLVAKGATAFFRYRASVIHLEATDLANLGLNLAFTRLHSEIHSEGYIDAGAILSGIMTDKPKDTVRGVGNLLLVSYKLPIAALSQPIIGIETMRSDKNYLAFNYADPSPLAFYVMRGKGNHLFYTQPLDERFKVRIGYMQFDQDYSAGLMGAPKAVDIQHQQFYINLRADI